MKIIIIFLALSAASCTARFIPQQSMQARMLYVQRQSRYLASLTLINTHGDTVFFKNKTTKGIGKTPYFIGDWYSIRYNDNGCPCDTARWTMAILIHNN